MSAPQKMVDGVLMPLTPAELADYNYRLANPPVPPVVPKFTYKVDLWRRATEQEQELLDGALNEAPAGMRRIFDAAQVIQHDSPEYPMLRAAIEGLLGAQRAEAILAPSE